MPISLFVERRASGLAFYINGDLQFDTADEAVYHEYLAIPTIALAVKRFPQMGLRVLICGGGDGLAARDVLRFSEVSRVDLVDYSPEVLDLARTTFKPYNGGSLESDRLSVCAREAFEFVSESPDDFYHAVICDFTYPTSAEDTSIYSREWFQQISRVLVPGGVVSTNGVSPENSTAGFWCLYQTLLSSGLKAKPLQVAIPSFQRHGYGNWGFFVASPVAIERSELEAIAFPENLQVLERKQLLQAFVFAGEIANSRHDVTIHTLDCPQLFYYLLNPAVISSETAAESQPVDFLDIQESGMAIIGSRDLLKLESMARAWLEQMYQPPAPLTEADMAKLLPLQHPYHSPNMTKEWLTYLKQLLGEIDLSRLLNSLLERSQELPPKLASELRQLGDRIRSGELLSNIPPKTAEFVMMLSVTLLVANLLTPDAVFAKGYYSRGSSGSSSSTNYYYGELPISQIIGFMMILFGSGWILLTLGELFKNESDN